MREPVAGKAGPGSVGGAKGAWLRHLKRLKWNGMKKGTWSIHSKCLDVNRLCLKMGRKSALKAAFAI